MNYLKRTWAEIDLDVFENNIKNLKNMVGETSKIMAVVKADAYGHGDVYIAKKLSQMGISNFGVSNLDEALALRNAKISGNILIFGYTPPSAVKTLAEYNITQAVFCKDYAKQLSKQAKTFDVDVNIHIKLDSGMGRIGFLTSSGVDNVVGEIKEVCSLSNLTASGIFTHFAVADETSAESVEFTRHQFSEFMAVINALEKEGITFATRHCCNSAGATLYPEMRLDMVRLGVIMYGYSPNPADLKEVAVSPVMTLKSIISMVKDVPKDTSVSYGRTYTSGCDMKIATIPIGYADGYMRALSNCGKVIVNGEYANIIGRVCMDQMMIDVTHIKDVAMGDEVTLFGKCGDLEISADDIANAVGTISYEILCVLGKRVPRIYIENGKEVATLNYINNEI